MTNLEVANTILAQLGGRRFLAMTGAKNLIGSANALSFKLPARFAKDGITHVRIELNALDTYDVTFSNVRGLNVKEVAADTMVYCDQLQSIFTARTGLRTSL